MLLIYPVCDRLGQRWVGWLNKISFLLLGSFFRSRWGMKTFFAL